MELENRILSFLNQKLSGSGPDTLLIGVSGGRDSMTLFRLLLELRDRLNPPPELVPVHFNHRLHDRSDRAARFVLDWSRHWDCEAVRGSLLIPDELRDHRGGVEASARRERFDFLEDVADTLEPRALLLAHHRRDCVETVLLNAGRGTGLYGLAGIEKISRTRGGLPIWRPLVDVPAETLHEWGDAHGVPFVSDPTNRDLTYARNRIRSRILPEWDRAQPDPRTALFRLSNRARRENDFWQEYLEETFGDWVWPGEIQVDLDAFTRQHPAAQLRYLHSLPRKLDVGGHGWSEQNYQDLRELFTRTESGKRISLPGSVTALREYDRGIVTTRALQSPDYCRTLTPEPQTVALPETGQLEIRSPDSSPSGSWYTSSLTLSASSDPTLRCWSEGDRTDSGTSLKTLFDRARIPYRARRRWPLISRRGDVVCIPGLYPEEQMGDPGLAVGFQPDHPCFHPIPDPPSLSS